MIVARSDTAQRQTATPGTADVGRVWSATVPLTRHRPLAPSLEQDGDFAVSRRAEEFGVNLTDDRREQRRRELAGRDGLSTT